MTLFQTNSELGWPQAIDSSLSPYQASPDELVLVNDGDGNPVVVLLPDNPDQGTVVAAKNVSGSLQAVTLSCPGGDLFSDGDGGGSDLALAADPGTAVIVRFNKRIQTGGPTLGGIWHVL